jgi:N-acetylglucosaminyl-diphospho-decaprenol L-rhamnosyltransferase
METHASSRLCLGLRIASRMVASRGNVESPNQSELRVKDQAGYRVAILIVGFRNPQDVSACLTALSSTVAQPSFDIFICENGGGDWFEKLHTMLVSPQGPCSVTLDDPLISPSDRLLDVRRLALNGRSSRVWIGCAAQNLGYAGGINVWIDRVLQLREWDGVWILNPDCEPEPEALSALVKRAISGGKGMVGSTILSFEDRDHVHCRGGHHWRALLMRSAIVGFRQPLQAPIDLDAIEEALDFISGASMYVTAACLAEIGPMDERFFLYYEDADWSVRAKPHGLGYASDSIVVHKGGTTIGSAGRRSQRSWLSVYLLNRNYIHFVRLHFRSLLPVASILWLLYAVEYFFVGSPRNCKAAIEGLMAGLKGETGRPQNLVENNMEATNNIEKVCSERGGAALRSSLGKE